MTSVVIYDLIFNMNFMGVGLPYDDQRTFIFRGRPLLYPVIAGDVPGIRSRKVRGLDPAELSVALIEYPVAVASRYHLPSPRLERAVTVPEVRVTFPQVFVRQFEIEIVTDTLKKS